MKNAVNFNKYWNQIRIGTNYNPFNPNFNIKIVDAKIMEIKEIILDEETSEEDKEEAYILFHTLWSSIKISNAYPSIYTIFKNDIECSNCNQTELYHFLIVILCRHYLLIGQKRSEYIRENNELSIVNIESVDIKSLDDSIGTINATSALESEVDSTNLLLNYLFYYTDEKIKPFDSSKELVYPVNQIKNLSLHANILYGLKASFESAIWNYGYAILDNETNTINLQFRSTEKLILECIGLLRFKEMSYSHYQYIKMNIDTENYICKNKETKLIDSVWNNNGFLEFSLIDGMDRRENSIHINYLSQIDCFYSFINKMNFTNDKYSVLTIENCISMLSVLSGLLQKVTPNLIQPDDSIMNKDDFKKFPVKIKHETLLTLFTNKTNFSQGQIQAFINIISTEKSNRLDLWGTPLVKIADEYLISYLPLTQPIICRFADEWLKKGDIPLEERGTIFENHVKSQLKVIFNSKGINYKVINKNKYENKNNESEEIDLVLELENILIIGEIKCIIYPMSNRDHFNSYEILKKASKQVKRKSDFLLRNKKNFEKEINNLDEKTIIKIVITNYPIFSGQKYQDIPIVDFNLIEHYFSTGKLKLISKQIGEEGNITIETVDKYYDNDSEMIANFQNFIDKPLPIFNKYDLINTSMLKVSPKDIGFDMFIEHAYIK